MDGVKPVATHSMPGLGLPRVMVPRMQHKVGDKLHIKHLDRIEISESNLYVPVEVRQQLRELSAPLGCPSVMFHFPCLRLGDG